MATLPENETTTTTTVADEATTTTTVPEETTTTTTEPETTTTTTEPETTTTTTVDESENVGNDDVEKASQEDLKSREDAVNAGKESNEVTEPDNDPVLNEDDALSQEELLENARSEALRNAEGEQETQQHVPKEQL